MYPVVFSIPANAGTGAQISAVKEGMRRVPDQGIGYGIHRYILQQHTVTHQPITAVRCNYLGRFDSEFDNPLFTYRDLYTGPDANPADHMTAVLDINALVVHEKLHITFGYNRKAHYAATIQWFTDGFMDCLHKILTHIRSQDHRHFTPSDFDAVDLDQQELNELFN
jgi:non-ribosomal peptide synthase protein (TIGR01720 family)